MLSLACTERSAAGFVTGNLGICPDLLGSGKCLSYASVAFSTGRRKTNYETGMMRVAGKQRRTTILLLEDNPDDVLLVRRALRNLFVKKRLIVVTQGEPAIAYLKGEGDYADRRRYPLPQLVLLDLKLRGFGGFEVLEWIRRDPSLKGLPVIVLTSSAHSHDLKRAYQLGANTFLIIPNDFAEFGPAVKQMVRGWLFPSGVAPTKAVMPPRVNPREVPEKKPGESTDC